MITIAVLDGPVDTGHACFDGADLVSLPTLVTDTVRRDGQMSSHGTHVASIIFGQPGSGIAGIAPQCRGLIVPIFSDERNSATQLDMARAIEQAANAGAQVINISGGQLTDAGESDGWLANAVRLCQEKNILIVAAAGNNGCDCLHVPAAMPNVLAVGAMDARGHPLDFSNWGITYQQQGILAPGQNILGAKPGGGTERLSGTSFATPIVSGAVALLLTEQERRGEIPDPKKVRQLLLQSALPCDVDIPEGTRRCLAGRLNLPGAFTLLTGDPMSDELTALAASGIEASGGCGCGGTAVVASPGVTTSAPTEPQAERFVTTSTSEPDVALEAATTLAHPSISNPNSPMTTHQVTPSQAPSDLASSQLVYALGTLGYDFGSEARRDTFKQLMPPFDLGSGTMVPANPYDARQMVDYLASDISEARSLIWTLNIELTPVYAIEPKGPFARESYLALQELLAGQIQPESSDSYIERVSIPGLLTGRTIKLFSGQVVPVIEPQSTRGLYGWKVNNLVNAAFAQVQAAEGDANEEAMRRTLDSFLNRIYYDLRNLGTTSQDRALNFAVTNAFQAASTFSQAVAEGMELDSITVEKSPFCRLDSDCWDVKLKFFDPENSRRAKKIFRFTIDVSDLIPVTLGEVKSWSSPY
ncbi:PatA/PatG family cyanobactin maturation protease [Phormidium sp. FACHB-1136]|uniref:S8 family peptidase n=1 Tax=Phormidium sp. FACHB-1136 TaxID=2692848 RepID=UPI00168427F6|nr:PatA/PatG family cyanobactin maturation protease [Phormidium sp. FACHB-1136]MBD2427277.1 PatA/PatG family cyanobactin maturation protease [Phormidium sp. FACHB-1136]